MTAVMSLSHGATAWSPVTGQPVISSHTKCVFAITVSILLVPRRQIVKQPYNPTATATQPPKLMRTARRSKPLHLVDLHLEPCVRPHCPSCMLRAQTPKIAIWLKGSSLPACCRLTRVDVAMKRNSLSCTLATHRVT